jgi:alpha-D-xyloside xylohydrolase
MDFGQDANVHNINDQYMFGPAMLINPVCEYKARTRKVYLPSKSVALDMRAVDIGWYEFKTGKYFKGGQTIEAETPVSDMPIFVKAGSIIPFGPAIQYAAEKTDPIRLMVYTGANAQFNLYEDENVNYNYEKGAHSIIPVTYDESSHILRIGDRVGKFPGMLKTRKFEIVWVSEGKPVRLDLDAPPAQSVQYNGREVALEFH